MVRNGGLVPARAQSWLSCRVWGPLLSSSGLDSALFWVWAPGLVGFPLPAGAAVELVGDSAQRQWSWAPHLLDHDSWAMEPHPQNCWQFRGSLADRVFGICPQSSFLGPCGFGLSPRPRLLGWLQGTQRPLRRNGVLYAQGVQCASSCHTCLFYV